MKIPEEQHMSLLFIEKHEAARAAAEQICRNFGQSRPMTDLIGAQTQAIPFDGLVQTIVLLDVAVELDDEAFFRWCGVWTYALFAGRMPRAMQAGAKGYVIQFCILLKTQLFWLETEEKRRRGERMLDAAIDQVQRAELEGVFTNYLASGTGAEIGSAYLQRLLRRDMTGAAKLIQSALEKYTLDEVYTDIIQNVMYEIGELWLANRMTVAQEHYCTAATQTILSTLYMRCLETPKNGHKAVVACIGSELHELGPRMVSDLMEYHGWDCIFLGAGVPLDTLMDTLEKEDPCMCCLSVALQQGVRECAEDVRAVRNRFPRILTAVGGHAFAALHNARDYIGADIFASDVKDLLEKSGRLLAGGAKDATV